MALSALLYVVPRRLRQTALARFHRRKLSRFSDSTPRRFSSQSDGTFARNKHHIDLSESLSLVCGSELKELRISWEEWGDRNLPGERTIVVFPSFSHSSHAASNRDDPSPGWWEDLIGHGKAINTEYFRVICPSALGAPFGTTSPLSINPATGQKFGRSFPQITPADMAACHARVLDHLGLDKVHAVVGGSMGGMQALEFAAQFPERLKRMFAISCTAKSTPGTVAYRRVQRQAIMTDPGFKEGNYSTNDMPLNGMMVARELGMLCYRSREEFDDRFNWNPIGEKNAHSITFEVEEYMAYQGRKFASFYDPNCYILLSKAMDLMDLGNGFENLADGLGRIKCETHIVGVQQDILIPVNEQKYIHDILQSFGRDITQHILSSKFGHDAMFLRQIQSNVFSPLLRQFVEKDFEDLLRHEQLRYSSL